MICFNAVEMFNASNCVVFVGIVATVVLLVASVVLCRQEDTQAQGMGIPIGIFGVIVFAITAMSSASIQHEIMDHNLRAAEIKSRYSESRCR